MSLSVLIPVYNRDVTLLVSSLASLLTKEKILSEIILLDDGSEEEYDQSNQQLVESDFIFYHRNTTNEGRIITRSKLGQRAQFNYLLFLDCDIKIVRPDFIHKYYEQVKAAVDVCTGGIVYDEDEPTDIKFKLHWKYGTEREAKRSKDNNGFLSSNFLIRRDLFLNLIPSFNSDQYGHEDTLWGIELMKKGITIKYIDNPVLHEGLEETPVYIEKSLQAVENLLSLEKIVDKATLARQVKLYAWYKKLNTLFLTGIIEKGEKMFHPYIIKNLSSYNPSLKYFDWMRLAQLIRLKEKSGENKK